MRLSSGLVLLSLLMILSLGITLAANAQIAGKATGNVTIKDALKEGDVLHVIVANNGTTAMNLTNWRLVTDNQNATFVFPVFMLKPSAVVTIHAHKNNNTATDLFGSNFLWNGTREIRLLDDSGMMVYDYHIGASAMKR